jgi:hypothetical protein
MMIIILRHVFSHSHSQSPFGVEAIDIISAPVITVDTRGVRAA